MLLANAYAKIGDNRNARAYLAKLQAVPPAVFPRSTLFDSYVGAYVKANDGRYQEAFHEMGEVQLAYRRKDEQARVASVQDMYKALRKELDSKTQESRLLVKQVQMRNLLLWAAGLIAILLAVISVGSAFWVLRMRRLHRNLNEAHEHAEAANAAKSRFLAVMSHELRTPLNGMLGMAQTLKKGDLNGAQREQVDIMVDSGETLLALLNDVLDMSRIEAGKVELAPSPATMKDMVDRVVNTYHPLLGAKDVVLSYHLDEGANRIMSFDVLRVYQCLSNLVSNAIKFTEMGSVRINVSVTEQSDGCQVRCEVKDTGIGMSKAVIDKLFEAYSQADAMTVRKYGGSGLGLSISRRLAELMGGTLSVTSDENKGSTFVLTFHAGAVSEVAKAEPISASIIAEDDDTLPGTSILLVDDHPINRKVARLFLEPFGFDITEAADGQEALDLDMSRFDLVLMDLNMPRMGGLEATRIFRAGEARGRRLPIVALTADAMQDQVAACHAAGMDAHIAKPIVMDTLIETVTRLLHLADDDHAAAKAESA
ncbi:ATP-binding protein [Asticcacaulis biprosthecium]|nr:ATP-binding protein [Asticcacaulis biprosthecium]